MAVLNNGRTGLGGGCVGAMKRLIELSIAQATQRKQFGKSISEFQLIKEKIATMTTLCFASESIVRVVGSFIDSGAEDFSVEAAMSKVFVSEALWTVADEALQIAGGNGFMREFPYERVVRDCRINRIFEGTNEILRLYVGLSGIKEPGEALADVAKGVKGIFNDPIKGFGILTEYASRKVGQLTPIGRSRLQGISSALAEETFVLEQGVAKLAQAVEAALSRYRKGIIEQQLATKRLADVATDLFVGMCVLSRVTSIISQKGEPNCQDELRIARIFTQMARVRISNNLKALVKNSDSEVLSLADSVLAKGSYSWDVL
jgi:alkylation response protein AidB-like acyl-CoA dehydrogenase